MIANTNVLEVAEPSINPAVSSEPAASNVIELPHRDIIRIRSYTPADKTPIQHLCCETGYFGEPADGLFKDRELFADLFTKAYLDYESDWGLVAEADGRVIGYLLGSISRNFDRLQMRSGFETTMKMLFRLASGRYSNHPRSRQFIRWLLFSGYSEQPKHPRDAAHLHYDIDKKYRGRGVGRRLWLEFARRAKEAGMKTCYGSFFSSSQRRPELAYARYGFEVYDRRRTTMFEPEIKEPVEVVCVVKDI